MAAHRRHILACGGALAMAVPVVAGAADETPVAVPSGQPVTLQEIRREIAPDGDVLVRFRFVAPRIARGAGGIEFAAAATDMDHLCNAFALPRLDAEGTASDRIVISLADRPVPFGIPAPEATQFFEAYSARDGVCIWEEF